MGWGFLPPTMDTETGKPYRDVHEVGAVRPCGGVGHSNVSTLWANRSNLIQLVRRSPSPYGRSSERPDFCLQVNNADQALSTLMRSNVE